MDKVDLLIGPYATGSILSAMGVAQRYDKLLVHHTFGIPHLAKYERQFPAWALGPEPGRTFPNLLFDALAASPKPPQTIAIVTDKFPSVHFVSTGARESGAEARACGRPCTSSSSSAPGTSGRSRRGSRTPTPTSCGWARSGSTGTRSWTR